MTSKSKKRKGLFRLRELVVIGVLILMTLSLVVSSGGLKNIIDTVDFSSFFTKQEPSLYKKDQEIQIKSSATKTFANTSISKKRKWIGYVKSVDLYSPNKASKEKYYLYQISFGKKFKTITVRETDLQLPEKPLYQVGNVIQIAKSAQKDLNQSDISSYHSQLATISKVSFNHKNADGGYQYNLTLMDQEKQLSHIAEQDLTSVYHVPLKENNSAKTNNAILRKAFKDAKIHPGRVLYFPKGEFKIGSHVPFKDYQILPSNTELRGSKTTFKVEGTAYWFGLATGSKANDGLKNFTMKNLHFTANDMVNGDQFMLMANHGDNWSIIGNSFTMVHKKGSHVFDLGGVQNATFDSNMFVGYAPDLTSVETIPPQQNLHDYYAEAIQFDASSMALWDGGIIRKVDSNYYKNNQEQHLTNNVTVSNNSFLPYTDQNGIIIAYGATIGQHSSLVGKAIITGNIFNNTLVSRYSQSKNLWVMKPIHFPKKSGEILSNNFIN
ncbi:hypothetical protein HMPREF9318_00382 [Streptococcus urinalis FB127-CNA-2]|uniref:hypothetical protein n=1 Tax=Streptococcus urinalis TaxID=149016 RepID=UPI0002992F44|nr:hypothetical protein [Streptococcus urinalis]EKS22184.1 hypothetical protein HMPREF9318_00382 [Streptococcus urinalis FB127-CNA-2]VEF31996.1 Uncharacterised protein [Streptococcus urinalis]